MGYNLSVTNCNTRGYSAPNNIQNQELRRFDDTTANDKQEDDTVALSNKNTKRKIAIITAAVATFAILAALYAKGKTVNEAGNKEGGLLSNIKTGFSSLINKNANAANSATVDKNSSAVSASGSDIPPQSLPPPPPGGGGDGTPPIPPTDGTSSKLSPPPPPPAAAASQSPLSIKSTVSKPSGSSQSVSSSGVQSGLSLSKSGSTAGTDSTGAQKVTSVILVDSITDPVERVKFKMHAALQEMMPEIANSDKIHNADTAIKEFMTHKANHIRLQNALVNDVGLESEKLPEIFDKVFTSEPNFTPRIADNPQGTIYRFTDKGEFDKLFAFDSVKSKHPDNNGIKIDVTDDATLNFHDFARVTFIYNKYSPNIIPHKLDRNYYHLLQGSYSWEKDVVKLERILPNGYLEVTKNKNDKNAKVLKAQAVPIQAEISAKQRQRQRVVQQNVWQQPESYYQATAKQQQETYVQPAPQPQVSLGCF